MSRDSSASAESRKPVKSTLSSPLHIVRGGMLALLDFSVSPSTSCGPIGDSAGPATQPIRMEETYHISDFFLLIQGFLIEIYTL